MPATAGLVLVAAAFVGFLDALYFVLVSYRWMRPDPKWMPPVCRMDEGSCARIVDTRYGRVFGLPNGVFGVAWYILLAAAGVHWAINGDLSYCVLWLVGAAGVLALTLFLAWALIFRLHVVCRLCFLAHALNLAILVLIATTC
jgi:uncharacterized membrane protein